VDKLSSTVGILALAGAALGAVAVLACVVMAARFAALRRAQRAVLGETGADDLVAHAARIGRSFDELEAFVRHTTARLDGRLEAAETRLDGAITHRALVRYDAYGEMSGRQSTSVALLNAHKSGVVLSSIHHREQARLYVKIVREGRGELELAPEEAEAVAAALSGTQPQGAAPQAVAPQAVAPETRGAQTRGAQDAPPQRSTPPQSPAG
jgi:hypothetical protein